GAAAGRVASSRARQPPGLIQPGRRVAAGAGEPTVAGLPVLGFLDELASIPELAGEVEYVVALGSNRERERAFARCAERGWRATALLHPSAVVLSGAQVHAGAQVCAASVIG